MTAPRLGLTPSTRCGACEGELTRETFTWGGNHDRFNVEPCPQCCDDVTDGDGDFIQVGERCECCMERLLDGERRYHYEDGRIKRALCASFGCVRWYAERRRRATRKAMDGSMASISMGGV